MFQDIQIAYPRLSKCQLSVKDIFYKDAELITNYEDDLYIADKDGPFSPQPSKLYLFE